MNTHNLKVLTNMAKLFTSTDETRYYLKGVFVEFHGDHCLYVATDGHVLMIYKQEGQFDDYENVIMPRDQLLKNRFTKKERGEATINVAESSVLAKGFVTVERDGTKQEFRSVDATFPDWRRIVPQRGYEMKMAWYDPKLLQKFNDFSAAIDGPKQSDGKPAKVFVAQNGDSPAWVPIIEGKCVGVIMPMRADTTSHVEVFW